MGAPARKPENWAGFIAILLLVGFFILWGLMPPAAVDSAWQAEQAQLTTLGWEASHRWVMHQANPTLAELANETGQLATGLGHTPFEQWLAGRLYVSLLWISIGIYRVQLLIMWALLGIPLALAAAVDGLSVREIRKHAFVSQSPIRHRMGVYGVRVSGVGLLIWICLPMALPALLAPAMFVGLALSLWMWAGNLQKRL